MTTPPSLPTLPGLGWSVHKLPSFSTRVAGHVSGREVRTSLYANTLYQYELTFDGLDSDASFANVGANSLQTLMGFFLQCQGQFGTFLYTDPTDCTVLAQPLGTGTGTTTSFTVQRTLGGFTEPVSWVTSVANVYLNGSVTSGWSLVQPNTLTFTSAPGSGVAVSADFSFAFVCRFLDDQQDFEEMMQNLWQLQSLKFRSVKP